MDVKNQIKQTKQTKRRLYEVKGYLKVYFLQVSPPISTAIQDLSSAIVTDPQVLANIPLPTSTSMDTPVSVISRAGKNLFIYNQATTKLAFHSNETSKDKLSIIKKKGYILLSSRCMPNYTKTCSFLHADYAET